jgi:hypothetical protein
MRVVAFVVLLLQLVSGQSAAGPLDRIRARISVDSLPNLTGIQIAGMYANPSKELIKQTGPPLAGEKLYIFPDNSYVYCEWADVMLNTVFDKGIWNLDGDILELKSDPEIVWDPELERRFLLVRRPSHKDEILLMGLKKSLPYFEKHAGDDPDLMLLIVTLPRAEPISQAATARLKATLMREGWHPDFFRK